MKLNNVEKALMNNPVRALLQRRYEAHLLERLGGRVEGLRVLEIGCGRGIGTEILFDRFGAAEVHAFDVDEDMVDLARSRLSRYQPDRLKLYTGDAAAIDEPDQSFDAVFDFASLHHVPAWQVAVTEVARVLKPGGVFSSKRLRAMRSDAGSTESFWSIQSRRTGSTETNLLPNWSATELSSETLYWNDSWEISL